MNSVQHPILTEKSVESPALEQEPRMSIAAGHGVEVIALDTLGLGDRSYLAHDGRVALVVDPQRDIDRVLALAAVRGVRITHVFETHLHNDAT